MWLLYAVGIPYIWYTLTRWRVPYGHGLNWKEPTTYNVSIPYVYGGAVLDQHVKDVEWHPDDLLRGTVTSDLPYGEPYHVPFRHREKGVAGECC